LPFVARLLAFFGVVILLAEAPPVSPSSPEQSAANGQIDSNSSFLPLPPSVAGAAGACSTRVVTERRGLVHAVIPRTAQHPVGVVDVQLLGCATICQVTTALTLRRSSTPREWSEGIEPAIGVGRRPPLLRASHDPGTVRA
jgi:hypothetical protein